MKDEELRLLASVTSSFARNEVSKLIHERAERSHELRLAELRAAAPPPVYDRYLVAVIACLSFVLVLETAALAILFWRWLS